MRKLNIEVEAVVSLPIKVTFDLLVRADHDANLKKIVKQFLKGNLKTSKADVEDVAIESAEFDDDVNADEPLAAHVQKALVDGGKFTMIAASVIDGR